MFTMKNKKTILFTVIFTICCLANVHAQENENNGNARHGRAKNRRVELKISYLSFGGGTSLPGSNSKSKAFVSNATAFNADYYLPLVKKGWDGVVKGTGGPKLTVGLNLGGTYSFGNGMPNFTIPAAFPVTGQTSGTVAIGRGGSPAQAEFRLGAGPQINFHFGRLVVSPMVVGAYVSIKQKEWMVAQTTQYNGQSYNFTLTKMPETKTSGFAITPKLRLNYLLTQHIGLFADAGYTMGPKIKTTLSTLVPNGNPNPQSNSYNIQQLQTGTMLKGETKSTTYNAMGLHVGVVIGLGKLKPPYNPTNPNETTTSVRNKTKSNSANERKKGDLTSDYIRKGWNGKIVNMVVPNTSENKSNIENITIQGSGQFTNNGLPIVYGKTVTGTVKAANGMSNAGITIQIEQKESNDLASTVTDEKGHFTLKLARDTTHIISVNNAVYGKIKIAEAPVNSNQESGDIRKGWDGLADATEELEATTPSNARTINNCCNATVTGSILWDPTGTGTASSFVPVTPTISMSLATITTAGGIHITSTINCLTYSGCADPTPIKYKVNGTIAGTVANSSYFTIPASAFPGVGTYTLKVVGTCGGSKCKAKTFQLTVTP